MDNLEERVAAEDFLKEIYTVRDRMGQVYELYGDHLSVITEWVLQQPLESFALETRRKAVVILLELIKIESIDLKIRWGWFLDLVYLLFVFSDYDEFRVLQRNVYGLLCDTADAEVAKAETAPICLNGVKAGDHPVVIVTSQFLSVAHAPTQRVLDYAYTISTVFNKTVVIINDANMNGKCGIVDFNYVASYNDMDHYEYKGVSFPFYQARKMAPDASEIRAMLEGIRCINPCLVFNVGATSILADLCRSFTKTASIPCALDLPISLAEYLILPRETRVADKEKVSQLRPYQKVVNSKYNYVYPRRKMKAYSRAEFDLADDDFVMVTVGNRLDVELETPYLQMLADVLEKAENAVLLFVGGIEHRERILEVIRNDVQVRFAGKLADACECLKIADVYLQPTRSGGGRSAFEAMYHGVPVVTTRYGDVWDTVGDEFAVDNYEEMQETVIRYYNDRDGFYRRMSNRAQERANELEDMESTFRDLFVKLEIDWQV